MQHQTRKLVQIQRKKNKMFNRRTKVAFLIKRKRLNIVLSLLFLAGFLLLFLNMVLIYYILNQLQRRMKIAELKQISTRPDVVEVGIEFSLMH